MRDFAVLALDVTLQDGSVDDDVIARGCYLDDGMITWSSAAELPAMVPQDAELMLWYMAQHEYPDITIGGGRWRFVWQSDELIPF